MRLIVAFFFILIFLTSWTQPAGTDYTQYVNPFIGTKKMGHTFPGVVIFYRMMQLGSELDIVFVKGLQPVATAEIKFTSSPSPEKGMVNCIEDLKTKKNFIITPLSDDYLAKENIKVCNLPVFLEKYLHEI